MEVMKDMVNLIKNIVPEVRFDGDDVMVWSRMVDASRIQLLYLDYQPRHLFPFDFPEKMALDIEHLKIAEKVFSSFKMDFTGEFWIGDKPKGEMIYRNSPEDNPEIEMKFEEPNPEYVYPPKDIELDKLLASFILTEKFDCKKKNAIIVREDTVSIAELEENYVSPQTTKNTIINERILPQKAEENKYGLAYFIMGTGYNDKPSPACKSINEFISTFGVVNTSIGIDYPMEMTATKYYNINGRKLTLNARLITAPRVEDIEL